jgi:peptidoglycan/LPS O-acetylase OafA/YrhL
VTQLSYRPDIDGLRAVAVMSVVLYHFGIFGALSGGFIGVDIFFVISGFLITSLIMADLKVGSFSLLGFYQRRIRRIFPAMLVVLAASLVAGYFFLLPGDYTSLGVSAAYSAASLANWYFLQNTGYFDRAADLLPLLHLWSLSVEEQFYLVWPLLLAAFFLIARKEAAVVAALVGAVVIIGLWLSVQRTGTDPKSAFFLAHLRAWELALGALLVFLPPLRKSLSRWKNELPTIIGVALIAISVLTLSREHLFPGLNAIPACVGAALIIWPRASESLVGQMLSMPAMRFIGLISYSLYLWHWPVLVFYRHYASGAAPTFAIATALAAASIVLAYLSWRFVEQPARRRTARAFMTVGFGVAAASTAAVAGLSVAALHGFPGRLSPEVQEMSSLEQMWKWECPQHVTLDGLPPRSYCVFGANWSEARTKAILWGDSHADHWAPIIQPVAERAGIAVLLYRECPAIIEAGVVNVTLPDQPTLTRDCTESRKLAIGMLGSRPDINLVILASAWSTLVPMIYASDPTLRSPSRGLALLEQGLDDLIDRLHADGRQIVIIGDVAQWSEDPIPCAVAKYSTVLMRPCRQPERSLHAYFEERIRPLNDAFRAIADKHEDVSIILPGATMCHYDGCMTTLGNQFLYRDVGHIRRNLPMPTRKAFADMLGIDAITKRLTRRNFGSIPDTQ